MRGGGIRDDEIPGENAPRLDQLSRDQWREVMRRLRPEWDDDRIDAEMVDFDEAMRKRRMN